MSKTDKSLPTTPGGRLETEPQEILCENNPLPPDAVTARALDCAPERKLEANLESTACASVPLLVGQHSMDLNVSVNDFSVSLKTEQSLAGEMYSVLGQLNAYKQNLEETSRKLDEANYRLGFFQAQVLIQQEQITQLREQLEEAKGQNLGNLTPPTTKSD